MNIKNPKVKILISYHDKHPLIKSDILLPIQTGCALAEERFEGMLQDDDGENISAKNPYFCELTSQYWAWKNYDKLGNPDYIGFMHYRRHFCFDEAVIQRKDTWLPKSHVYKMDSINTDYVAQNFAKEKILAALENQDCLVLKPYDVKILGSSSNREHYARYIPEQDVAIFDAMLDTVLELFPGYKEEVENLKQGTEQYLCNMFVMKKNLFFQYSDFLFTILDGLEQKIDYTHFSMQQRRFLGYMGEYLLSLFVKHAYRTNICKISEIKGFFIENIDSQSEIYPIYEKDFSTIVMSSSHEYLPYLSVCLQSLVEHSSTSHCYDIVIMERNIPWEQKEKLKKQIARKNISVRFLTISDQFKNIKIPQSHYSEECSYRVLAPLLLKNYKRIIFTDCDLVFMEDVAKLDLVECPTAIAACRDMIMNAHLGLPWADWKVYCKEELQLENIYDYYNTGVMIINIPQYIKENIGPRALNILNHKQLRTLEQDALNCLLKNKITYLNPTWNFLPLQLQMKQMHFLEAMDLETYITYMRTKKSAKIIHYAAARKPWYNLHEDMAEIWWDYARRTPYYEELCLRLNHKMISEVLAAEFEKRSGKYSLVYLRYLRCKLMAHITCGKKRDHYKEEWLKAKNKVQMMRQYRK